MDRKGVSNEYYYYYDTIKSETFAMDFWLPMLIKECVCVQYAACGILNHINKYDEFSFFTTPSGVATERRIRARRNQKLSLNIRLSNEIEINNIFRVII
jgi:hypothetical protein